MRYHHKLQSIPVTFFNDITVLGMNFVHPNVIFIKRQIHCYRLTVKNDFADTIEFSVIV